MRVRISFDALRLSALVAAGVITWIVGLFTGALMLLIVGGSLAVAGACGLFARFD